METIDVNQTRQAWDSISENYDKYITPSHNEKFTAKLLQSAGLKHGMKFLDVAAGSGALTIPAAKQDASVTAVDLSPKMISLLKARAEREGLTNVEGLVMDGHDLDFQDDTFDVSGSQFGVMLFPDLPKGLSEMVRVTKPGGSIILINFRSPDKVDVLKFFFSALQIVVPDFAGPPALPFQVSDPDILRQRMEEAGLKDILVYQETEIFQYSSGEELWNSVLSSNPIASQVTSGLTNEQLRQVQQALNDMFREQAGENGNAALKAELNVGVGRKSDGK